MGIAEFTGQTRGFVLIMFDITLNDEDGARLQPRFSGLYGLSLDH